MPEDDDYYLPPDSIDPQRADGDRRDRRFLTRYLQASDAMSLSCGVGPDGYRAFWGGGSDMPPVVVTMSGTIITVAQFKSPNEAGPVGRYTVARRARVTVETPAVRRLRQQLDSTAFWSTGPNRMDGEGNVWVIEARRGGAYKAVLRVRPEPALADFARTLVQLSGLPVPALMTSGDGTSWQR